MRISNKGKYAVKFMFDLAYYGNGEPIKIKEVAKRQDISEKYLEQVVAPLSRASLVRSIRGAKGGYKLSRKPENYTVGIILKTVEGNLMYDNFEDEKNINENDNSDVTLRIWDMIDEAVNDVLEDIKLSDLIEWQNQLGNQYVI